MTYDSDASVGLDTEAERIGFFLILWRPHLLMDLCSCFG